MAKMRLTLARTSALAMSTVLGSAPAYPAGNADEAKGLIADQCVRCHEVPGYEASERSAAVEAPSFAEISGQPEVYTEERLRRFLQSPHWPMAQFHLSQRDIDNLLAFIETLRSE